MGHTTKAVIGGDGPRRRGVEAIETGGRLLAALAAADGPMMLRELADAAQMAPAKAHRYLVSLIRVGLARPLPESGRYDIGPLAIRLGVAGLGRGHALAIARERLPALRDELGLSVALAIWLDSRVLIVDWLDARALVAASLRIGASMPLTRSASGRAFAALRAELAEKARAGLRPAGPAEFDGVLRATRAHGIARVTGDLVAGIDSLAAPVHGPAGTLAMVVAAIGPSRGFDVTWNGEVACRLRDWAREIGSWPATAPA